MSQVTKRALEQSLKNLLLKKPLTKITVGDIADDCGINRMTFYYHFKDIYDLVEWSCLEDAKRALDENKTYETWQQGLLQIFEAVQANKPFILNVYRCVHREQVEKYLQPLVDRLLLDVVDEEAGEMTVRAEDRHFIAQVYSYIFIGLMLDWIKDDMRDVLRVCRGDFSHFRIQHLHAAADLGNGLFVFFFARKRKSCVDVGHIMCLR